MKVFDIFVNIAGELEELLCRAGRLLLRGFITLGLAAALDTKELVDGIGLRRSLSCTGFSLLC